ncbi:MAG TPA: tetratricopeptide repeat protein [Planctomycetota bacterium]|nr:tetratricopeptide repeat protein [Planctomycetota bacterium]
MNVRRIAVILLLAQVARADKTAEDLEFASRLAGRGLEDMAFQILDALEKSPDPAAARAGRYGKAALERGQATLKRLRFLRDLEEGVPPRVTREEVLAAYADAEPKIREFVENRPDNLDARFLLAALLQEYAEFLTGRDYPDSMAAQREQLVTQGAEQAEKLFQAAIANYDEVVKRMTVAIGNKDPDPDDPNYVRLTQAQYQAALAVLRLALLYPKGPKFNYNSELAIEKLDTFMGEHYEELHGAFAMRDLGEIYYERAVRLGNADDMETAANYFKEIFTRIPEDPSVKDTSDLIARALCWYGKSCNALARGEGEIKKPQPAWFENAISVAAQTRERLKYDTKNPWALKALLEAAQAYAAQNRVRDAVAVAGEVLASARVAGLRQIGKDATDLLTPWVGRVAGVGVLDAPLLFEMGEALSAQGQTANAIAFYEKAVASATTDEDRVKIGYPALVRIAREYRRDRRLFAAAEVANRVVDVFVKDPGHQELSDFGATAGDACNLARLCWKDIADATKRPQDDAEYKRIRDLFVKEFPGHPENSDQQFSIARELYAKGEYAKAAEQLADISTASRNYWQAQRMVPGCYRQLAIDEKDGAKAKAWHEKALAAAQNLVAVATKGGDDPQAATSRQTGDLFVALSLASLERWQEALAAIDQYLSRYGDPLVMRGAEYVVKIDAHLALNQLQEAESALAVMLKKAPPGPPTRYASYQVFKALFEAYQKLEAGAGRVSMAGRAAAILETWLETQKDVGWDLRYRLGQVLFDAQRWGDAAEAFEASATLAPADRKQILTLQAAEAKYQQLETDTTAPAPVKLENLAKVRDLFTDVLVPPDPKDPEKKEQKKILAELANPSGYPTRATFDRVKKMPRAIYVAAQIYAKSSPAGIDGRYLAIRLITLLHEFTIPASQPGKQQLDEFIPIWWDAAELKLRTYLQIAQSGGAKEKEQASLGLGYARKLQYENPKMDGPQRVAAVAALEAQLKPLAPK